MSKMLTISKKICWVTNVYRPNDHKERRYIWTELQSLSVHCLELWCIGGDFNITRWAHERFPIGRVTKGMRKFNNFIDPANLMEIPLSNRRFTWLRDGNSAVRSLIDRFFINKEWDEIFENTRVSQQTRTFSNHFPLLLEAGSVCWGPSPFRFYNSWLLNKDCNKIITGALKDSGELDGLVLS